MFIFQAWEVFHSENWINNLFPNYFLKLSREIGMLLNNIFASFPGNPRFFLSVLNLFQSNVYVLIMEIKRTLLGQITDCLSTTVSYITRDLYFIECLI